jgi:hypothetical protein
MFLYEAVNPLHGLPKHWIKYLTERYGKQPGYYYGKELAGESSHVQELPKFDAPTIRNAFKDENVIAIIGRKEGEPLFMIVHHYEKITKYQIFEVTPGRGRYDSKMKGYYRGRSSRDKDDDYTMPEIMEILNQMVADKNFANVTVESITKDPVRGQKIEARGKLRSIVDPFAPESYDTYNKKPHASPKQKELIKKYAAAKHPKFDEKVNKEVEEIKKQVMQTIDAALVKTIQDVKKGYTFSIDKKTLGEQIVAKINLEPLRKLASAYSALQTSWGTEDKPGDVASKLKQLGLQ